MARPFLSVSQRGGGQVRVNSPIVVFLITCVHEPAVSITGGSVYRWFTRDEKWNNTHPTISVGSVTSFLIVGGKATTKTRNRGSLSAKNSGRNTAVVYSQSRVSQQEEIKVESSSATAVVADRVHPLSDLALHEPGELTTESTSKQSQTMEHFHQQFTN